MALDGILVRALTAELRDALTGAKIQKIQQPEPEELLLTLRTDAGARRLLISANASLPLCYLTGETKPAPLTAPGFCMLLRKHIGSGRITAFRDQGLERCIDISIEHLDELGDLREKHLIIELMGRYSNAIFTDESYKILDALKRVPPTVSSVRTVLPGQTWFVPETQGKADAFSLSREAFIETLPESETLTDSIFRHFTGFSVSSVSDFLLRAGFDGDRRISSLTETEREAFADAFFALLGDLRANRFSCEIARKTTGEPAAFSALPLTSCRSSAQYAVTPVSGPSALLESYFSEKNLVTNMRERSADLRRVVKTHLERAVKKYDLQAKQLKDTDEKETDRLYGELLTAYAHALPVGETSVNVLNYYTNEEISIPTDPDLSIAGNAKRYYDRYGKLKRTREALTTLIRDTEDEITHLTSVLSAIDLALDPESLKEIREELAESGYVKRNTPKNGRKERIQSEPYHYLSSDGFHLYVGKNNLQNDALTHRFAEGSDLWFHVKNAPGSHVILRTEGQTELPDRAYEEAAALAVYYSSKRDAGKAEVDYTEKRNVKKPAGSRPGFVVYYTNYSMLADGKIDHLRALS